MPSNWVVRHNTFSIFRCSDIFLTRYAKSYMHPKVELSENYLFFLYGDNEIEMCDPIYNVYYEIGSIEGLDELSRREDLQMSKLFAITVTWGLVQER